MMSKKFLSLLISLSFFLGLAGCGGAPSAFTQTGNNKNYSRFLWGEQKRYIIFRVNGSEVSPVQATASPYQGNKSNLYCLTTEADPCENFPASNRDIFSQTSHKKVVSGLLNALAYGGTVTLNADTLSGEKIYDPNIARSALGVLSQKILAQYTQAKNDTSQLLKFIQTYHINTDNEDILVNLSEAYNQASNQSQKAEIERYLVNQSLIKFSNFKMDSSGLRDIKTESLLSSTGASGRDYTQKFKVSIDQNAGIPVKYNTYKVNLKVTFFLDFYPYINGENKDFVIKEETVTLSPQNNYQAPVSIHLRGIPSFGFIRPMGLGFLTGMSRMLGAVSEQDARDVNRGIPFELKKIRPEYEVVSIEAI